MPSVTATTLFSGLRRGEGVGGFFGNYGDARHGDWALAASSRTML